MRLAIHADLEAQMDKIAVYAGGKRYHAVKSVSTVQGIKVYTTMCSKNNAMNAASEEEHAANGLTPCKLCYS